MNEIIKKFLEAISLSKDHWIVILSTSLLVFTIGGTIYIKSLYTRIESLNENMSNWKEMVEYHKDNYEVITQEHETELKKIEARIKVEVEAEFYKTQFENVANKNK